jgi:hypothetical protein
MISVAQFNLLPQNMPVPKTTGTGFGDLDLDRRITADRAVFLCPLANVCLLWAGLGGDTFGYAGVLSSRFANPALCPPSHLTMGAGLTTR